MKGSQALDKGWALALGLAVAIVALLACTPHVGLTDAEGETPPITGRVFLPAAANIAPYTVQATISDVASAATVVLIDTTANITRGTTLSDATGKFSLTFGRTFKPTINRTYYLEAVRGLGDNAPGKSAARVRTLLAYTAGGWLSLNNAIGGGSVNIGESTTALAALAALKGPSRVDPMHLIGTLAAEYPGVAGLSQDDFLTARTIVSALLANDNDPIAGLAYDPGPPQERIYMRSAGGSSALSVEPATASITPPDNTVTFRGIVFDTTGASSNSDSATLTARNVILFNNTATATVTGVSADRMSLYAVVPPEAVSGPILLRIKGQLYGVPDYSIWGTLNVDVH